MSQRKEGLGELAGHRCGGTVFHEERTVCANPEDKRGAKQIEENGKSSIWLEHSEGYERVCAEKGWEMPKVLLER